jgi:predicted dehydrogenase
MASIKLGVIGYGDRGRSMVYNMCRQSDDVRIAAIADPRRDIIRAQMQEAGHDTEAIRFYGGADEMLARESLDGVVVATRCSQHTPNALKVLERGLPLFLEKPVATSLADLQSLRLASALRDEISSRVVVSFPLRVSSLVNLAREIIDSGQIGTVEHVQAWNNVPYGDVYYQDWYRDEEETGGLFLQKATHDFDYINSLLGGNRPVMITAMKSKQVFRGEHQAGLRCMDCRERTSCYDSPYHRSRTFALPLDATAKQMCAFAVDTGNEDSGSAIIQYESGMHVAYSQNFFVRNKAGKRGARFIGYKGTLEFDWTTGILQVFMHHSPHVITHTFDQSDGHGGGDPVLASNFLEIIRGNATSMASLADGILSALTCIKAKESAETHTFQPISFT